ncbi:MAG: carboxypeptidase-like regulatory domain-containing protein, partial [Acidobacteria bacterium]|nr:carboxypeptidase-like regulatory domain-containing protein [Acidobacteriota bacterium]
MRYLLMALLLLGAASPALHAQTSFVTGKVSVGTQGPAGGMIVSAYNTAGQLITSEVTRSDGTYTLSLAAGATYKLLAYDPAGAWATSFYRDAGSFETSTEISLVGGETMKAVNFVLERGFLVTVTVSAPAGAAVSDVVVAAYNLNGTRRGFQKVGPTGQANLVLPAGSYKIVAYDEDLNLATEFYSQAHSFGTADTVVVDGSRSLMIALEYGGTVSGIITDRDDAAPLGGLTVLAFDLSGRVIATGTTDAAGRYSF